MGERAAASGTRLRARGRLPLGRSAAARGGGLRARSAVAVSRPPPSAGFDAHVDDPLATLTLTEEDFEWITAEVARLGGGTLPLVSVLEGGYNSAVLARTARAHVRALIRGTDRSYV